MTRLRGSRLDAAGSIWQRGNRAVNVAHGFAQHAGTSHNAHAGLHATRAVRTWAVKSTDRAVYRSLAHATATCLSHTVYLRHYRLRLDRAVSPRGLRFPIASRTHATWRGTCVRAYACAIARRAVLGSDNGCGAFYLWFWCLLNKRTPRSQHQHDITHGFRLLLAGLCAFTLRIITKPRARWRCGSSRLCCAPAPRWTHAGLRRFSLLRL